MSRAAAPRAAALACNQGNTRARCRLFVPHAWPSTSHNQLPAQGAAVVPAPDQSFSEIYAVALKALHRQIGSGRQPVGHEIGAAPMLSR